ncbi:hypothetical protein L2D08_23205 [Domibacillus sp. PGB-M46]|uniref:hypothetical protein n=1 Tax=Domibacillus sp. PGB-M46 TaxID=2910255 RepID=UPI001F58B7EB|nr:hypothetical protein [Domibacillus sp. PGB-M46]MCI2257223.1 hypothetical protein [Domibacillus sp. PGB-M46]
MGKIKNENKAEVNLWEQLDQLINEGVQPGIIAKRLHVNIGTVKHFVQLNEKQKWLEQERQQQLEKQNEKIIITGYAGELKRD